MTIAAVILLGWLLPQHAGDLGPARSSAVAGSVGSMLPIPHVGLSSRELPPERRPGWKVPPSFLVEEEDEDDSVDEAPLGWAQRPGCASAPDAPAGRLMGLVPVRVASRSAAPTLRLRC